MMLKSWFKKLMCSHYWYRTDLVVDLRWDGLYVRWVCVKCGKKKAMPFSEQPLNYIEK